MIYNQQKMNKSDKQNNDRDIDPLVVSPMSLQGYNRTSYVKYEYMKIINITPDESEKSKAGKHGQKRQRCATSRIERIENTNKKQEKYKFLDSYYHI